MAGFHVSSLRTILEVFKLPPCQVKGECPFNSRSTRRNEAAKSAIRAVIPDFRTAVSGAEAHLNLSFIEGDQ